MVGVGVALVVVGVVAVAGLFVVGPVSGCTEVGTTTGPTGEFAVRGVEGGDVVYSPDGLNECSFPVEAAMPPAATVAGGLAVLAAGGRRAGGD
jgi:hypothetical protein